MFIKHISIVFLAAALAACSPKVDNRGYVSDVNWKEQVVPGKTTKEEILSQFGSPSSQSSFGPESWYYISQRKETVGFMATEIAKQHVVRIEFDEAGVARNIEQYDENQARDFDLVKRTTPTEGHTLGFVEQVLGNIGRFNKPSNNSPGTGRRSGGGGGGY